MNKKQNVKQETIASVLDITFEEPYTPPCMHSKSTKQKNSFMKDEDDDLDKTMLLNDIDSKVINLLDDDDDELDLKKTVAQISKGGDGVVDLTKEDNVPADTKVAVGKSLFIDVNRWKGLFDKADENDEPNIRKETKKNESTKRSVTELLSAKVKALYPKKSKKENQVVIEDDIIDEDEDNEEFEDDLKDEDYEEENPPEDDSEHEQDIESEEEDSIEVQKAMNAFNGIPFVKEIDFKRNPIEPAKCNAANLQHGSSSTSTAAPIVVVNYPSNWLFGHETKENKENIPKTRMTTAARKKAKLQEDTTKEAMSTHRLVQLSRNSAVFKEVEEMFIGDPTKNVISKMYKIMAIHRNENRALWNWYAMKREEVAAKNKTINELPGKTIQKQVTTQGHIKVTTEIEIIANPNLHARANEQYLFHGSRSNAYTSILTTGFDIRVASMSGSLGAGIYFAPSSSTSLGYLPVVAQGTMFHMLLNRVTLGKMTIGNSGLRRPPPIDAQNPNGEMFDSVTNVQVDPKTNLPRGEGSMNVIFDNYQAYPEYLITFQAIQQPPVPQPVYNPYNYNYHNYNIVPIIAPVAPPVVANPVVAKPKRKYIRKKKV